MSEQKRPSGQRSKKRKFTGNRYTRVSNSCQEHDSFASSSAKKLKNSCFDDVNSEEDFLGYRLIDIAILFKEISDNLCCKLCGSNIKIQESNACGLFSKFILCCDSCKEVASIRSSAMMGQEKKVPEINHRIIYAMRCIGNGWAALNSFCSIMDFLSPVQKTTYSKIVKELSSGVEKAAKTSMKEAAEDEKKITGGSEITVSGDGSWKTRGHTSQIGMTSIIGAETGKVLDIEVMSTFCKGCSAWKKSKSGSEYEEWKEEHSKVCIKNHSGSAGKMEVDGMLKIFHRSEESYDAKYVNYIGDGDTKTFMELQKSKVYGPDCELKKIECVGHVQKRLGTRLRNLKKNLRGKKLDDGKSLCGKGRLTDKLIDQLTSFYGNAIRQNKNNLMDMRKAVWAVYYHKRSTDEEPFHDFCPPGNDSWCKYQKAKAIGKQQEFHHKTVIPTAVMDCIKPIFKDLSDPALLRRCLGGKTQNCNESFNSLVWKFCPKISGSSKIIADIAANEAVVIFNEGRKGRLHIMKNLGFQIGNNAVTTANKLDEKRVKDAERQITHMSLEYKRAKYMQKTSQLNLVSKNEGSMYKAGNF